MQAVILILRAIQKEGALIVKRNPSIPSFHKLFLIIIVFELFLLEIRDQFFKVLLANVAKQQIIKRFNIGIRTVSDDIDSGLRAKDMPNGYKQFPPFQLFRS